MSNNKGMQEKVCNSRMQVISNLKQQCKEKRSQNFTFDKIK